MSFYIAYRPNSDDSDKRPSQKELYCQGHFPTDESAVIILMPIAVVKAGRFVNIKILKRLESGIDVTIADMKINMED